LTGDRLEFNLSSSGLIGGALVLFALLLLTDGGVVSLSERRLLGLQDVLLGTVYNVLS